MGAIKLKWFELKRKRSGDVSLRLSHLADVAPLLDSAFPALVHTPWTQVEFGHGYAYYEDLNDVQIARIEAYLQAVQQVLVVRRTEALAAYFTDELDSNFALAFNQVTKGVRSDIGKLEYQAKYRKDAAAAGQLGDRITEVCNDILQLRRTTKVAAIPSGRGNVPDALAAQLARRVSEELGKDLIKLARQPGPPLKNLSLRNKLAALEGQLAPIGDVTNQRVLLIDDLCQSGTSLWVAARKLKAAGAVSVDSLACVKSFGDTDNQ